MSKNPFGLTVRPVRAWLPYKDDDPPEDIEPPGIKPGSIFTTCARCASDYVAGRPGGCPWCEDHPAGIPADIQPPWRRSS